MSYSISVCGPGSDKNKNGGVQTFENVPANGGTTITCDSFYEPGKWSGISTENYAKINKAYQIIQKAFGASGQDIPALSDTKELNFEIKGKKMMKSFQEKDGNSHGLMENLFQSSG